MKSATALRYFFEVTATPTLSDACIAKLRTTLSGLRALLARLPPDQATPILARLAEMERILDDQKPPT